MLTSQTIFNFLNSNFVQSIATVGAIVLGFYYFFAQQRANRLQKIYFDDALLKQVREIDDGLTKVQQHSYVFAITIDDIFNLISQTLVDKEIILKILIDRIASIQESGQFGESTKEIINFLIPDERGDHITQWFTKYNADIVAFSAIVRGQLSILANEISLSDTEINKNKYEEMLKEMQTNIIGLQRLLIRHRVMIYWFCSLVRLYADLKFSNREELASAYKKEDFSKIISNLDESFKMLFCFYETNEEQNYFSYVKDENGRNFRIIIENDDKTKVTRESLTEKPAGKMNIIINDRAIADAIIEDTKDNFVMGLVGLVNLHNFERRPSIISEKQRFV